ncbi:MAG: conjugal transfer protein TrbC [Kineosporiaceae bacterium]
MTDVGWAVWALPAMQLSGVPTPGPTEPPGADAFLEILNWVAWGALALCVLGVIGAGVSMVIAKGRGEGGEVIARLGWALAGSIVVGSAAAFVTALLDVQ